jgi:hypothetical protein
MRIDSLHPPDRASVTQMLRLCVLVLREPGGVGEGVVSWCQLLDVPALVCRRVLSDMIQ